MFIYLYIHAENIFTLSVFLIACPILLTLLMFLKNLFVNENGLKAVAV